VTPPGQRQRARPAALPGATVAAIRTQAVEDQQSVVDLIQRLVRVPSQGGVDPYDLILDLLAGWLSERGLSPRYLLDDGGAKIGLACDVAGARPVPRYVLDACVDTAPVGDERTWRHPPLSGVIEDGWLYGRGAADCKAGAAIFAHVAARLHQQAARLHGTLTLLYDADEHTGRFGGAKRYFAGPGRPGDVAGVMIGYPGLSKVVVGGRGFLRAVLTVRGEAAHSGDGRPADGNNAVEKAALLVRALGRYSTPGAVDPELGLVPKLTVTAIAGGEGYSVIPDRCQVHVDVRLTKRFDVTAAATLLERVVSTVDRRCPAAGPTEIRYEESWPAYQLDESAPVRVALLEAATQQLGRTPRAKVVGPSNIGCYLASLGIEATAGFGVAYRGLHAADECIELATIPAVQATYHQAVLQLLWPAAMADGPMRRSGH
jgi:succinyl-diaminopimelate desuccinylase